MSNNMIQFENFILNKDEISHAKRKDNLVIVTMKCGQDFTMSCYNDYSAKETMAKLTIDLDANPLDDWKHPLVYAISNLRTITSELNESVKKILKRTVQQRKKLDEFEKNKD